jgi:hypothetical protein
MWKLGCPKGPYHDRGNCLALRNGGIGELRRNLETGRMIILEKNRSGTQDYEKRVLEQREEATERHQAPPLPNYYTYAWNQTMRHCSEEEARRLMAIAGRVEMGAGSQVCSFCGIGSQVATGGDPDLKHESTHSVGSPYTCECAFLSVWAVVCLH